MKECDCCGADNWVALFSENGFRLGRCDTCALHYINPMPAVETRMTEMEQGHFAGNLKVLDADRQLTSERISHERFSGYAEMAHRHVSEGRWLDIGCGSGTLIELAQERGFVPEGIELTADRRAVARRMTGAPIHDRPVEEISFDDDTFSVISLINVFSHLTSPKSTLIELQRILRPGGVIILATAEFGEGVKKSHMFSWSLGDHLYFLGEGTMERYARQAGLQVLEHERTWIPNVLFSKERFRVKGRSKSRNTIKAITLKVPGGLPMLRALVLSRAKDNPGYAAIFALGKP